MVTQTNKQSITDINVRDKRCLVRVDYNVPLNQSQDDLWTVSDDTRIRATIPTIRHLQRNGARCIVLISHLGRPNGKHDPASSLKPVASRLEKLLSEDDASANNDVLFVSDSCISEEAHQASLNTTDGQVVLLENCRFHPEEEAVLDQEKKTGISNDKIIAFRNKLTRLGDVYINDAFGTSHRAHSSMVGIELPHRVSGLLLKRELEYFHRVLQSPKRPFLAILGGAKVKDKIQLIGNLLNLVDEMIIVGGMTFTFKKKSFNINIGKSLYDKDGEKIVDQLLEEAKKKNVKIHFPTDYRCHTEFKDLKGEEPQICSDSQGGIPDDLMGLDIGPESEKELSQVIGRANTILWNGPAGVFEFESFCKGSEALLKAVCSRTSEGAISIIGGGDTASLVVSRDAEGKVSHVSTGGGASLELCEGKNLPGVNALDDA